MPRTCSICASPKADAVRVAILSGVTDVVVAKEYGFSRPAMQRHRLNHIEAPARQVAAIAGKGRQAAHDRAALATATAADPRVWLALDAITSDLKKVHDRLDQAADEAATARQGVALSSLSSQLLRANELRAKLGGVGQETKPPGSEFRLTINLGGDGPPITIYGGDAEHKGRINDISE